MGSGDQRDIILDVKQGRAARVSRAEVNPAHTRPIKLLRHCEYAILPYQTICITYLVYL